MTTTSVFFPKVPLRKYNIFGGVRTRGGAQGKSNVLVQLKNNEGSTHRCSFDVYTTEKNARHDHQRKEIGA